MEATFPLHPRASLLQRPFICEVKFLFASKISSALFDHDKLRSRGGFTTRVFVFANFGQRTAKIKSQESFNVFILVFLWTLTLCITTAESMRLSHHLTVLCRDRMAMYIEKPSDYYHSRTAIASRSQWILPSCHCTRDEVVPLLLGRPKTCRRFFTRRLPAITSQAQEPNEPDEVIGNLHRFDELLFSYCSFRDHHWYHNNTLNSVDY